MSSFCDKSLYSESVSHYEKGFHSNSRKAKLEINKSVVVLKWITFTEEIKCNDSTVYNTYHENPSFSLGALFTAIVSTVSYRSCRKAEDYGNNHRNLQKVLLLHLIF